MPVAATEPVAPARAIHRRGQKDPVGPRMMRYLPRGNLLDDAAWQQRHKVLEIFLLLHLPALAVFGVFMRHSPLLVAVALAPVVICLSLGDLARQRRLASFFITAGIVYCSAVLVALANGAIEAHFHFFIIIGFIALYQDWVPFLWNILFTVLSHGLGSAFGRSLMFNHHDAQADPWRWSVIHGIAVLAACVGMVLFWRTTEDEQQKTLALTKQLGEAEIGRRKFTSELLVNLARRNQSMLYRQLDIINQLEQHESDPDALAELFRLDHLATRIRRNAESLLVLSGEEPSRVWSKPVQLTDVIRAAIAETEDLNRVVFVVDERLAVLGHAVTDLTHLLAELIENAVRSSPPESRVTLRSTPDVRAPGTVVLTVEDWGVGMRPEDLLSANEVLAAPRDVDAVVSKRLGLHVISRLAYRYKIQVMLTSTSGSGITAVVLLPPELFASAQPQASSAQPQASSAQPQASSAQPQASSAQPQAATPHQATAAPLEPATSAGFVPPRRIVLPDPDVPVTVMDPRGGWGGWWESDDGELAVRPLAARSAQLSGSTRFEAPQFAPFPGESNGSTFPPDAPAEVTTAGPARLNQRTPQTHLAPELQRGQQAPAAPGPAPAPTGPDAERAREALSRYQASRQAALADQDTATKDHS
jgi:signal transduction histidine kinase